MKLIKAHWAEAVLILCGIGAIDLLLTTERRSSEAPSELDAWYSDGPAQQTFASAPPTGPEAVPMLLEQMRRANSFRSDLMAALTSLGPAAVPSLVAAFEDRDDRVRLTAVRAFASLRGNLETQAPVAMPGLIKLLGDPNREIRYGAALGLVRMGPSRMQAIPALRAALTFNEREPSLGSARVQQVAAYVLGKIGPGATVAVPELLSLMDYPSPDVRLEAAVALWRITKETNLVVPELRRMLTETNPMMRDAVYAAVRRIGRETRLDPCLISEAERLAGERTSGQMQSAGFGADAP
jgi:HEAT repeat protein